MINASLQMNSVQFSFSSRFDVGPQGHLGQERPTRQPLSPAPPAVQLSQRQTDVLRLLVQGQSNKEIARTLNLGLGTVKIHVTAVFHKLGVSRRAAAAVVGAKHLAAAQSGRAAPGLPAVERTHPFGALRLSAAA